LIVSACRSLSADGYAANTFVTTFLAGSAGLIGWVGIDWLARDKTGLTGYCAGTLVGLVAIAAGSGYVAPQSAIVIGLLGGAIGCRAYGTIKRRFPGNGLLIVFSLHAVGGVLGVLLAAIFATPSVAGFDQQGDAIAGLVAGDPGRLAGQAWAIVCAATMAVLGTIAALMVVRIAGGNRSVTAPTKIEGDNCE
jgi:Amt family ammonium transporter